MQELTNTTDDETSREVDRPEGDARDTDLREVEEYLSSDIFQRVPQKNHVRLKDRQPWPNRDISPRTSFWMAMVGFSAVYLLIGSISGPAVYGVYSTLDPANEFEMFCVLGQLFLLPMVIGLAFATATPLFWHGAVFVRFALAALVVMPGAITFAIYCPIDGVQVSLFAMFLAIAFVSVLVQLWTQWTISHSRSMDTPITPTGTRSIMELTGIASVCCAIFAAVDLTDIGLTIGLSIAVAGIAAVAVIGLMIALLRPKQRNLLAGLIAGLFAFTGATVLCGTVVIFGFGFSDLGAHLPELTGVIMFGGVNFFVMMLIGIWWLRTCGWVCLNHEQERMAREAEAQSPWHRWFPEDSATQESDVAKAGT